MEIPKAKNFQSELERLYGAHPASESDGTDIFQEVGSGLRPQKTVSESVTAALASIGISKVPLSAIRKVIELNHGSK